MKLRLTMIASPPGQGGDTQRHLATGKLTLGRGSDNNWVLRDEERVLSKNHCVVEFKSGVYVVIDSSTNGVFHNESLEPLGRGNSAVLADGDRLRFGAFVLKAQFVADDPLPEAADPFLAVLRATADRTSPAIPDDPFDDDPFAAGPKTPVAFTPIPAGDDDEDGAYGGDGAGFLLPARPRLDPAAAEAAWRRDNPEWAPVADRDDVGGHEQAWSGQAVAGGAIPDDWDDDSGEESPECSSPPCFASYFPEPVAAPAPPQPLPVAAIPDDWADPTDGQAEAPAPAPVVSPFAPSPFLADDGAVERLARQAQAQAQGLDAALPAGEDSEAAVSLHMRALLAAARRVMADAGLPVEYLENAYRRALDEGTL